MTEVEKIYIYILLDLVNRMPMDGRKRWQSGERQQLRQTSEILRSAPPTHEGICTRSQQYSPNIQRGSSTGTAATLIGVIFLGPFKQVAYSNSSRLS